MTSNELIETVIESTARVGTAPLEIILTLDGMAELQVTCQSASVARDLAKEIPTFLDIPIISRKPRNFFVEC
tara:strand:- start:5246 stop:5461 length:216 start_codon:yes stop_codon:yes gene_type:complete